MSAQWDEVLSYTKSNPISKQDKTYNNQHFLYYSWIDLNDTMMNLFQFVALQKGFLQNNILAFVGLFTVSTSLKNYLLKPARSLNFSLFYSILMSPINSTTLHLWTLHICEQKRHQTYMFISWNKHNTKHKQACKNVK